MRHSIISIFEKPKSAKFNLIIFLLISFALLLQLVMQSAYAEKQPSVTQLQRLFTTPLERARLDALRRHDQLPEQRVKDSADAAAAIRAPLEVEVNGMVIRKNAPNVVWVNGKSNLKSNQIDEQIRVRNKAIKKSNSKVPVLINDRAVKLKPGQVWNEADASIKDKYQIKRIEDKIDDGDKQVEVSNNTTEIEVQSK